jgi:hypothetical protein
MNVLRTPVFRTIAVLIVCSIAGPAAEPNPFAGTWVQDPLRMKVIPTPQIRFDAVPNGVKFSSSANSMQYTALYEGKRHPVTGIPVKLTVSLTRPDAYTVVAVQHSDSQAVSTTTFTMSADHSTLKAARKSTNVMGKEISMIQAFTRVGTATDPDPLVGVWQLDYAHSTPVTQPPIIYEADGTAGIRVSVANGMAYSAKFDGKDYPVTGSGAATAVSLKKTGPRSFKATWKSGGKVTSTTEQEVSADGKVLTSTGTQTDAKGETITTVQVYRKQK